jgi:hypothetical protein
VQVAKPQSRIARNVDIRWDNSVGIAYARWFYVTVHNQGENSAINA